MQTTTEVCQVHAQLHAQYTRVQQRAEIHGDAARFFTPDPLADELHLDSEGETVGNETCVRDANGVVLHPVVSVHPVGVFQGRHLDVVGADVIDADPQRAGCRHGHHKAEKRVVDPGVLVQIRAGHEKRLPADRRNRRRVPVQRGGVTWDRNGGPAKSHGSGANAEFQKLARRCSHTADVLRGHGSSRQQRQQSGKSDSSFHRDLPR